jgi:TRAP-type mannitol/chloroaromatic compound transport system permease small subunit
MPPPLSCHNHSAGAPMAGFVRFIDRLSMWTGHAFAWCIVILTLGISYEVVVRYLFRAPTTWAFDIGYMMYGAMFFMAGAYTLSRGGHVRADILYRLWSQRTQATLDLILYVVFFFPGMFALIWAGIAHARQSWRFGEVSIFSPAGIPIYPLKILVPIGATLLFLQGLAECLRCVRCLHTGSWPPRFHDVEELEAQILAQHQKREKTVAGSA